MIGYNVATQIAAQGWGAPLDMVPLHPQAPGVWIERHMVEHYRRQNPGMLGTIAPMGFEMAKRVCPKPGWDVQAECRAWGLDQHNPHRPMAGALGAARRFGPPFKDRALQQTYIAESRKLAGESVFVTLSTARALVAATINSALAAAEAATPAIEARVRREAESAAKAGVGQVLLGAAAVTALGLSAWVLIRR